MQLLQDYLIRNSKKSNISTFSNAQLQQKLKCFPLDVIFSVTDFWESNDWAKWYMVLLRQSSIQI